jgi:hypothetical protein
VGGAVSEDVRGFPMSQAERKYYLVPPESPVMAGINKAIKQKKDFSAAILAIEKEFGAKVAWLKGSYFDSLEFEGEPPEGWKKRKRDAACIPDQTKTGRAIRVRIKALPRGVDGLELSRILGCSHWEHSHVYFPIPEKLGDQWILSVHRNLEKEPEGCIPIKVSEYYRMVESQKSPTGFDPIETSAQPVV